MGADNPYNRVFFERRFNRALNPPFYHSGIMKDCLSIYRVKFNPINYIL